MDKTIQVKREFDGIVKHAASQQARADAKLTMNRTFIVFHMFDAPLGGMSDLETRAVTHICGAKPNRKQWIYEEICRANNLGWKHEQDVELHISLAAIGPDSLAFKITMHWKGTYTPNVTRVLDTGVHIINRYLIDFFKTNFRYGAHKGRTIIHTMMGMCSESQTLVDGIATFAAAEKVRA